MDGRLLMCNGGFYYVQTADAQYECRARGVFRKQGITPLAGDRVQIEPQAGGKGTLIAVLPRKNALVRPAVANLDALVIVASIADPRPHLLVIDKMIALAEDQGIEPVLVVSKTDLGDATDLETRYRAAGFTVFTVTKNDPAARRNKQKTRPRAAHHPHRYPAPVGGRVCGGHPRFFVAGYDPRGYPPRGAAALFSGVRALSRGVPVHLVRPRQGSGLCRFAGGKRG